VGRPWEFDGQLDAGSTAICRWIWADASLQWLAHEHGLRRICHPSDRRDFGLYDCLVERAWKTSWRTLSLSI